MHIAKYISKLSTGESRTIITIWQLIMLFRYKYDLWSKTSQMSRTNALVYYEVQPFHETDNISQDSLLFVLDSALVINNHTIRVRTNALRLLVCIYHNHPKSRFDKISSYSLVCLMFDCQIA